MREPVLSIIIPVYQAEDTLRPCLDSALAQEADGLPLEVICVDDGSTDGSLAILEEYAQKEARVTALTQRNQYAGAARNRGMAAARGKYLAFLDADDILLPGGLEALYRQAERHGLDWIKGAFVCQGADTGQRYTTLYSTLSCVNALQRRRVLRFDQLPARLLNVPDVPWNGLYRRTFLEEHRIRFNHLRCVNDHSFYIACLLHARRLMVTRRAVACYRVGRANSLVGGKAAHFEDQLESCRIVRGLCRETSPDLTRQIMRQELNGLLGWYERLLPQAADPEALEAALSGFLRELDEDEVGAAFVRSFSYGASYFRLRYGTEPPQRPPAPLRALRCWQEHGLRYTWEKLHTHGGKTWEE